MHDVGWPDKDDFPYRALIRIRYSHEIDLVALDRMRAAVCHVAPPEIAREVTAGLTRVAARIASKAVDSLEPIRSEQSAERFDKLRESLVSGFLNAYDDDDWCGTGPHWWKHFRRPLPWPPPWESSWQGPGKEPWKIEAARSPASEGAAGSVEPEVMPSVELVRVLVAAIEVARGALGPENLQEVEGLLTKPLELLAT